MDVWAASYGSAVAFICVSCAGPQLATQFGNELKLKHCHNTWADQDDMPTWGQLGCNGLIVLDGSDVVVCSASPAYLEVKNAAFRHVETLLGALLASKPAPTLLPGRVDGTVGGACAEVRFGSDADAAVEEVIVDGLSSRPELNGKRGRVVAQAANGRVEVQIDGEKTPLAIKRQNLTPVAEPAPSTAARLPSSGSAEVHVPSVKVDVLDEEHEQCERKLALLGRLAEPPGVSGRTGQIGEALRGLLAAYEAHFAHEEALLDQHLYADLDRQTGGFSADKGARTSHFADHQTMLSAVRELMANSAAVCAADVLRLAADFERHATEYDGGYADRLSAALAQTEPVAVA